MMQLVLKEAHELLREKRFPVFMTTLASVLGAAGFLMLAESAEAIAHDHAWSFREPVLAFLFIGLISSVLLALTFAADAVAKERDQGMLPLLLTTPVTHAQVFASKFAMLMLVYAAYALVNLSVAALLSISFGFVVLKTAFLLLVGPLGAFYVFLAGLCLFLSTMFTTSKAALATGVAAVLPLFLTLKQGPIGYLLFQANPRWFDILGWLPVEATVHAAMALARGGAFGWAPLLLAATLGIGFLVVGYFAFRLREVAL